MLCLPPVLLRYVDAGPTSMAEGKHPVPPPPMDRLEVGPLARAPAAVEYRTIPPTINVRYKQRPPPLRLLYVSSFVSLNAVAT